MRLLPKPLALTFALLAALVCATSALAQGTLTEYKAFHYVRNPETDLIDRVEISSAEYEEQQNAMKQNLKALIAQVLLGQFEPSPELLEPGEANPLTPLIEHPNFLLLPHEISSEERERIRLAYAQAGRQAPDLPEPLSDEEKLQHFKARMERLFVVPDEVASRIKDNPEYLDEVAESMAAWTVYYLNLSNWHTYVAQNVIREELEDDEKPQYDPSIAGEDVTTVYTNLQEHAQEVTQDLKDIFLLMVYNIEKDTVAQASYEDWLASKDRAIMEFANRWMRRREGREIQIDDTLYMVRTYDERPKSGAEDRMKEYLPTNGVLVEVPKKELVTPFDLIGDDGKLRQAEDK